MECRNGQWDVKHHSEEQVELSTNQARDRMLLSRRQMLLVFSLVPTAIPVSVRKLSVLSHVLFDHAQSQERATNLHQCESFSDIFQ